MGQQGWISIHRKIRECWLYNDKPFDRTHAWLDLLLSANHQDNKFRLGNELVEVKRGSFITSIRQLCEKWGWSNTKVTKFLELLEKDKMITVKSDKKKTLVTIENYSVYQDMNVTETSQKRQTNDTETTQKHTNNNDNNVNKLFLSDSNEYRLAEYLYKYMLKNNPKAKQPNYQNWSKHFDYILRIDKKDLEEVKAVIKFAQTDSFWCTNILSPAKLREQYDQLILKMKNSSKPRQEETRANAAAYSYIE